MDITNVFTPFAFKSEKQEDGSLLVTGIATDPSLDSDNQVCDPTWLKSAMPSWFEWGNIREQHSSIAAGVATELKQDGDKHVITARIVDPNTVKKIENDVLKGFSIGIRNPRVVADKSASGGRIIDGQIVEVSVVDRPANPTCRLTMAKAATPGVQVAPEDFEKGLVRTEEFMEAAATPDATTDKAAGSGTVQDESVAGPASALVKAALAEGVAKWDAAAYSAAWKALATLIQAEAVEMEAGSDETYCISLLVGAAQKLQSYLYMEQAEGEVSGGSPAAEDTSTEVAVGTADSMLLAVQSTLNKTTAPDPVVAPVVADTPEISEGLDKALRKMFTDLVQPSMEALAESVATVTERVSQVEKQAKPTGPVRTVVKQVTSEQKSRKDELIAKSAEYRQKALTADNKALADGYRQLAREAEVEAAAL